MNTGTDVIKPKRRRAKYDATLVFMDEPQVMTLVAGKARIIGVAVPCKTPGISLFYATSVSSRDWNKYLGGAVDLRYLFTFPDRRNAYTFDLATMKAGEVMMTPHLEVAPEEFLPSPKFFADNHTEDYARDERPDDVSTLYVDGEWELVEFGQFNQRYADIYAFSLALKSWANPATSNVEKQKIRAPFLDRPYQGGFSYVHLFADLNDNVPVSEQLSLDKIQYASPGFVDMFGKQEIFTELQILVMNFLKIRPKIVKSYNELYGYLHKNHYLKLSGNSYIKGDPTEPYITQKTSELNELMGMAKMKDIKSLTGNNALVSAKVILSVYRRLNDLSLFFAQGRVSFEK